MHALPTASPHKHSFTDDEDENDVGHYNEASIRYKGGSIPSKAFRMLKSMTGGDGDDLPPGEKSKDKGYRH